MEQKIATKILQKNSLHSKILFRDFKMYAYKDYIYKKNFLL